VTFVRTIDTFSPTSKRRVLQRFGVRHREFQQSEILPNRHHIWYNAAVREDSSVRVLWSVKLALGIVRRIIV
jgi:hypothetical protein